MGRYAFSGLLAVLVAASAVGVVSGRAAAQLTCEADLAALRASQLNDRELRIQAQESEDKVVAELKACTALPRCEAQPTCGGAQGGPLAAGDPGAGKLAEAIQALEGALGRLEQRLDATGRGR